MRTDTQPPGTLSLSAAAKAAGKSKSTISRAIREGRLSAEAQGNSFAIQPAELFRVYPKRTDARTDAQPPAQPDETAADRVRVEMLERLVAQLEEQLAQEREDRRASDARADTERARMDRLLEDRRPPAPVKQGGLLARLLGQG
jgi:hypothetical protein